MKKLFAVFASILLVVLASGCGSDQVAETVDIPKYDPNKKPEVTTSATDNGNQTATDTNLDEPTFPKATPATEWTMVRRTPDNMAVVDAEIKLPLKKKKDDVRFISFGAPRKNEIWGSPVVKKGRLYFGCEIGYLSCNKFDTGEPVWRNEKPIEQICSSFAVNDSMVFFGVTGVLYAYDLYADIQVWKFETGPNILPPAGVKSDNPVLKGVITDGPKIVDDNIYFGSWDGKVYCLECKTGKMVWNFQTKGKIYGTAVSNGKVYLSNSKGEIISLDATTGKQIWSIKLPKGSISSPVVFGSRLWVGCKDSKLYCLSTKDGKVLWSYQAPNNDFGIECCPAIDEKNVYCTTAGGVAFALDRKTGKEIWSKQTSKVSLHADPLVVRNQLICADLDGGLFILDKNSGKVLDTYNTTGNNPSIKGAPIVIGNQLVFSCYDSNIYIMSGQ